MFMNRLHTLHFVCLKCRRSVKCVPDYQWQLDEHGRETQRPRPEKCSQCGEEMLCLGRHFAPPRRRHEKQWKKLEYMIARGWPRSYWQTPWKTTPSMTLSEVKETEPQKLQKAQQHLLALKAQRKYEKKNTKARQLRTHKAQQKRQCEKERLAAEEWQRVLEYQASQAAK